MNSDAICLFWEWAGKNSPLTHTHTHTHMQSDGEGSRGGDHTHLCSAEGCGRRERVEITCPQCHLTLCLA